MSLQRIEIKGDDLGSLVVGEGESETRGLYRKAYLYFEIDLLNNYYTAMALNSLTFWRV